MTASYEIEERNSTFIMYTQKPCRTDKKKVFLYLHLKINNLPQINYPFYTQFHWWNNLGIFGTTWRISIWVWATRAFPQNIGYNVRGLINKNWLVALPTKPNYAKWSNALCCIEILNLNHAFTFSMIMMAQLLQSERHLQTKSNHIHLLNEIPREYEYV